MSEFWAIERQTVKGEWVIDHTTIRFTRREAWCVWEKWRQDPKVERRRRQRAGTIRAVKVRVERLA